MYSSRIINFSRYCNSVFNVRHYLLIVLICSTVCAYSQNTVEAKNITIDFDRTIHIVLANTVEYVSSGSDLVEAVVVKESPNIVRITALEENFKDKTNVTIISKGGAVFSYNIIYSVAPDDSSVFFPESDSMENEAYVTLNSMNAAHLIFPNDIIYFKQGNEMRINVEKTSAENILKIKGGDNLMPHEKSNLFCVDNKYINYNIHLGIGDNASYTYNINPDFDVKANVRLNEERIEDLCKTMLGYKRKIYTEGFKKNKYEFSLNNLFINNEQLFFVFELKNKSNIDLDVDFIKCFIIDEKPMKKAAQQEPEVKYKFVYNLQEKLSAQTDNSFVLVFDKFTIPDKKIFKVEIYEKGGGRHINFKIKNNTIMKASTIQ